MEKRKMSFESKQERKIKRKSKLDKFKSKKFKMYGDIVQKNPYKRKDKYEVFDDFDVKT